MPVEQFAGICYVTLPIMKFQRIWFSVAAGIFLLLIIQLLYDPISSAKHSLDVNRIQTGYSQARAQWEQADIRDYTFEIRGSSQSICPVNAVIQVRDNRVTEVHPLDLDSPLPTRKWEDPFWGSEVFLCSYANFTFTHILDMVYHILQTAPSSLLAAEFDPGAGFVTRFQDGIFSGNGWLNPKVSEFYNEFTITDFQEQ